MKINQILAILKGKKSQVQSSMTKAYQVLQKSALFSGIQRTYQPRDEEGEKLPEEKQLPQTTVDEQLAEFLKDTLELYDLTLSHEIANCTAMANVVVDEQLIVKDAPVTFLLFLEKKLNDIHSVVSNIPILADGVNWNFNEDMGMNVSEPVQTTRTKKIPKSHVLYEATDKHPAQVQPYTEDIIVGDWTKVDYSTAIPRAKRSQMIERVDKLRNAVKIAREEANSAEVKEYSAEGVLKYIFG